MFKTICKALLCLGVVLAMGASTTLQAQYPPEEGSCVIAPFEFDDHDGYE